MSEPQEYGMVMPFVTVASKGGPHDDQSYVAGYEMGLLDARLEHFSLIPHLQNFTWKPDMPLRVENRQQAELVAMKSQFVAIWGDVDDSGEWINVEFYLRRFP